MKIVLLVYLTNLVSKLSQSISTARETGFKSFFPRDHSFSAFAKFPKKLTYLTPWYAHVRLRIRGVRNVSFSESFANILNRWSPRHSVMLASKNVMMASIMTFMFLRNCKNWIKKFFIILGVEKKNSSESRTLLDKVILWKWTWYVIKPR